MNLKFFKNKTFLLISISGFFAMLISLNIVCLGRYPAMGGDEIGNAATAHNLLRQGTFACPVFPGSYHYERRIYIPPVPILLMYISYLIFGFGIWQTKIVSLACGLISTMVLFLLTKRITNHLKSALLATIIFSSNIMVFISFQNARPEAIFLSFFILILYLASLTMGKLKSQLIMVIWFLMGVLTGITALTYYPFAIPGGIVSLLLIKFFIWGKTDLLTIDKWKILGIFILGSFSILTLFLFHVAVNPALFKIQILRTYTNVTEGWVGVLKSIAEQYQLYLIYGKKLFGFFDIFLVMFTIFFSPYIFRNKPEKKVFWQGLLVWVIFLVSYSFKRSYYLTYIIALVAILVACINHELKTKSPAHPRAFFFRVLVYGVLGINLIRLFLVSLTLAYQWKGRDYRLFNSYIQEAIPSGASAVVPQVAFYALADRVSSLHLYTQGSEMPFWSEASGETLLNEPNYLKTFNYIILQENYISEKRLEGLVSYTESNFVLLKKIRMPFRPLSWAAVSPFDVDVYVRRGKLNK